MKRLFGLLLILAVLPFLPWQLVAQESAEYVVIVNHANKKTALSKDEISALLLKKDLTWADGTNAEPVDLDSRSKVREAFSRDIHGRSVASIKNYWQRQIFSGREVPPPEVTADSEVIAHVRTKRGAIGYVSASTRIDGIQEIHSIKVE